MIDGHEDPASFGVPLRLGAVTGTGQFGANTLAAVKRIQQENGLGVTGILGPNTWKLAWTGKF